MAAAVQHTQPHVKPGAALQLRATSGGGAPAAAPFVQPGMEPNPLCAQLPVFDLSAFLNASNNAAPEVHRLCAALAACLRQSSALVVRDPRVDTRDNETFLSLLERYFSQPLEAKLADVRAHLAYQVGSAAAGQCEQTLAHNPCMVHKVQPTGRPRPRRSAPRQRGPSSRGACATRPSGGTPPAWRRTTARACRPLPIPSGAFSTGSATAPRPRCSQS